MSAAPAPRLATRASSAAPAVFAVAWLGYFAALQWSVVRYRIPIVIALTAATIGLGLWQWRGWRVELTRPSVVLMLAGSALATLTVPLFSYLAPTGLAVATTLFVAAPLVAAALLWTGGRRSAVFAAAAAILGYAAAAATAIVSDPRPHIDVWVTLQQASDGLGRGENFYAMTWVGSPGIKDAFTYLPWTAVLLAPGRWLVGDVRWALLVWTLAGVAGLWALARGRVWAAAAGTALVLLAPGTLTQVDQAWTEPLLWTGLVWWAVLVRRGHAWWAVLPLALACASKQHLVLLLPVLLLWRPFGWRRTLATGAAAGLLVAPWFVASPADFLHDTLTLLLTFHPIVFANTLYLLALNTYGVTLPFAVTGLAVLGTLGACCWAVWRRQPDLAGLLRWLALLLLVANLVNKQAFYNQFWLVGAVVVASLVAQETRQLAPESRAQEPAPASRRR
jgi:hypothetical protein